MWPLLAVLGGAWCCEVESGLNRMGAREHPHSVADCCGASLPRGRTLVEQSFAHDRRRLPRTGVLDSHRSQPRQGRYACRVTELRVVVPDEIAERLAAEAADRGTSTEQVASEVLVLHVPAAQNRRLPRFVGKGHSGRHDLSERVEEILSAELDK